MADISLSELKRLLDYDPVIGVFRWLVKPSKRVCAGSIAGNTNQRGYRRIMIGRREILAHRLAWFYVHGQWPDPQVDHINGVLDDNRIVNLREATPAQNCWNRRKQSRTKSGLKGVHRRKNRWEANIMHQGRAFYLGQFKTPKEAHDAYCNAAKQLHGDFARVA